MLLLCRVSVKHSTGLLETHMSYSINGYSMPEEPFDVQWAFQCAEQMQQRRADLHQ